MKEFDSGSTRLLITTEILPRRTGGRELLPVINYDLPSNPENYIHRTGRGGHIGPRGVVINLVTTEEVHLLKDIERKLVSHSHRR